MNIEKEKIGYIVIALVSLLGIVGVLMLDPIAQDLEYHLFKDQRTIIGIPNFWNVISNLPFFYLVLWVFTVFLFRTKLDLLLI